MHDLDRLKIFDYDSYSKRLDSQRYISKEIHHVLALQIFGPDIKENKAKISQIHHVDVHKSQDIPYRYWGSLIRKQRARENGHIVITESDLKGRQEIQGLYLEGSNKLPEALQDMNIKKLYELLNYENIVNAQLKIPAINIDTDNLIDVHGAYMQAQIERSKHIYKVLKGFY